MAHIDGLLEGLALNNTSDEATGKRITGTIGVVDLALLDGVYRNLLDLDVSALLGAYGDCRVGALREDNSPWALGVLLGSGRNLLGNLLDVLGLDAV